MDEQERSLSSREPAFGERVEVRREPIATRELGSYAISKPGGAIYSVTVRELSYDSTKESVSALGYSFEEIATGQLKRPLGLALVSFFSTLGLLVFAVVNLVDEVPKSSVLPWIMFFLLAALSVTMSVLQSRRSNRALRLIGSGAIMEDLKRRTSGEPVLDLPRGRVDALRASVEEELKNLPSASKGPINLELMALIQKRVAEADGRV